MNDGPTIPHRDWLRLHRDRGALRAAWAAVFERVDVLLCPVTSLPAFEHLQRGLWSDRAIEVNGLTRRYLELEAWPAIVGAAYLPSTATPVGATDSGLPVGVQIVAPFLHDRLSIQVSSLVAEACAELGGGFRVAGTVSRVCYSSFAIGTDGTVADR